MPSASISLAIGILSFVGSVPILLPIIGFALGANSYIQENKKTQTAQNQKIKKMSMAGTGLCASVICLFIFGRVAGA